MTKDELIAAYQKEIEMRRRELKAEIASAIERLTQQESSTHLGHNLANHATAISLIQGKIDGAEMALRSIRGLA